MPICASCGRSNPGGFRFCPVCGSALADEVDADAELAAFVQGRYVAQEFLGEGGKKKVYLAHDTVLDRDVAFALIKADSSDDASRARVTREAQAMGRVGSHPNIVTVFDLGEHEGQPYMVTELMAGGDVEGLVERAPDHRVPIEQAVEIAKSVCRGLEFAHARQLVHRDLKPGNVWLTEDGVAKIGDFGLALALDRSRLTREGLMVGTVAFMPPEQALGGEVGPRSDLYSLGAMLYELVTGRPPFLGDDPVAVISQHINTPPVAPRWHNPECPRALEALIVRLLAKDPAERPESAADVLSALESLDTATSLEQPAPDEGRVLDSLAGGVFVGRQRELGELKAALEDALSGRGRLVTLVGEPGIGKTRTALELATYAGLRGAQVLWGRCYESQGAPPYWPWVQVIRSYVREHDPEQLLSEMGAGAAEIAEIVSDVRQRLPVVVAPPPETDPQQARFRLFDSITSFLKSAARSRASVLVLDDLHWGDAGSLLLLEFIARELGDARLLVIGTYRDMELSRRHPLAHTLAELARERLFERIPLRGLGREDVGRFVEATSGLAPPGELVEAVYAQTEGNPLFVTEIVRLLAQEGELTAERLGGRERWSMRIPEGVREVIGRRLDRLSERCNATLQIASVIGREFTLEQLGRLVDDLSEDRLLEVLEEALAARVIEELPHAIGRYQFTHALIQETLADELSSTRRARLHARIAEALEELYGAQAEAHAAELAHHFAEAEAALGAEKLVRYSQVAGEAALAARAHGEALVHFERALAAKEGQPLDAETAELLFGLGRAQLATAQTYELERAVANMTRAFEYYAERGDTERAVAIAAYPFPPSYALAYTWANSMVGQALTMAVPGSPEEGRLRSVYGWFLSTEGEYERAVESFERALANARRRGDVLLESRTLVNAAHADWLDFRLEGCLEKAARASALVDSDDHLSAVTASGWMTRALIALGRSEDAEAHGMATLAVAEKLRHLWWLAIARGNLALLSALEGDWAAVRHVTDTGLAGAPRDARMLAVRASAEYETGDYEQGAAYVARLCETMPTVAPPGPTGEHAFVAGLIPHVGRIGGADELVADAEAAAVRVLTSSRLVPVLAALARAGPSFLAVRRGDADAAEPLHAALQPARGGTIPFLPVSADRLLGLLAGTMGRLDLAADHFEDALAFCEGAGYRPELAWTACDYADLLERRGDRSDRASALRQQSLAIAKELGMRPLMERVLARRPILNA